MSGKYVVHPAVLMGIILVFSGCSVTSDPIEHAKDGHHPIHHDELLVLDPPEDYIRHLPDLGMEVIDVQPLSSIGANLYHLRITDEAHPVHGRKKHEEKFPEVIVDAHHIFDHHARKIDKTYTARKAARWHTEDRRCSIGFKIGVIDGYVNVNHDAFKGTPITHQSFLPKNKKTANTGHGTNVVSAITGHAPWTGVLPGTEIMAANVFYKGSKGKAIGSSLGIVLAIDWMVKHKVPIINMSIGGGLNKLIKKAVEKAAQEGTILVASAGNSGPFTKKKSYPAAYDPVIAITAVDKDRTHARFASAGKYIDFAAPGVGIWVASDKGGKKVSGTSFAAPIFTSYAAAAMRHKKLKTSTELKKFFKKHAVDTVDTGHDKYTGWGVVEVPPICGE